MNLLTAASPLALPKIYLLLQVTHFISLSLRHELSP